MAKEKCPKCGQEMPNTNADDGLDFYLTEFIDDLKHELEQYRNTGDEDDIPIIAIRDYDGRWYSPTDWEIVEINGKKVLTLY